MFEVQGKGMLEQNGGTPQTTFKDVKSLGRTKTRKTESLAFEIVAR
jgi:hypothetical protein